MNVQSSFICDTWKLETVQSPSPEVGVSKLWCIHTGEYYSEVRRKNLWFIAILIHGQRHVGVREAGIKGLHNVLFQLCDILGTEKLWRQWKVQWLLELRLWWEYYYKGFVQGFLEHEWIISYLNCRGGYTNPYIIELQNKVFILR